MIPDRVERVSCEAFTPVPSQGIGVVSAASGAAIHLLVGEGDVRFDRGPPDSELPTVGTMTVGLNSVAFLIHPEHGAIGFSPGNYLVTRQRELANGTRFVED